jgi:hypothetical protein
LKKLTALAFFGRDWPGGLGRQSREGRLTGGIESQIHTLQWTLFPQKGGSAMSIREPVLHPTPILSLRPTQITLGMYEVLRKRDAWSEKTSEDLAKFLTAHMVPVITGFEGAPYLIDHHHLARALYEQGVKSVFVTVVADLSRLSADLFWNAMAFHNWVHPYDSKGRRRPYSDLPKTVKTMEDDPYRSLAGELRNVGGFAKDSSPFSEFLWADFLRPRIKAKAIKADFAEALNKALVLAKTGEADYLPGWCGPHGYTQHASGKAKKKDAKGAGKERAGASAAG